MLGKQIVRHLEALHLADAQPGAEHEEHEPRSRGKRTIAKSRPRRSSVRSRGSGSQLDHVRYLDQQVEQLDTEVAKRLAPFEMRLRQLDTIPVVNQSTAESIVAVIGTDMTRFPNADHLTSWGGMCPGVMKVRGSDAIPARARVIRSSAALSRRRAKRPGAVRTPIWELPTGGSPRVEGRSQPPLPLDGAFWRLRALCCATAWHARYWVSIITMAQEGHRGPQCGQTAGTVGLSGRNRAGSLILPPLRADYDFTGVGSSARKTERDGAGRGASTSAFGAAADPRSAPENARISAKNGGQKQSKNRQDVSLIRSRYSDEDESCILANMSP
jgi:Transposase IS116/IS110/IS902 family